MKLQYYKDSNNNNNIDDHYYSSASKENNEEKQNNYLIKFRKLYGNSFSDVELLDIFSKNNYNENEIKADIKALLEINDSKKLEYSKRKDEHYSPSFGHSSNNKKNKINTENIKKKMCFNSPNKEKEKENNSQKDTEVPSDYAPPPKHGDIRNLNMINNDENINDILLEYKKEMFNKLKCQNYSYKSNKSKKDELNYDNISKCRTEKNIKTNHENDIIDINKNNIVITNNSPGPECITPLSKKQNQINNNQEINKELKKKYIKYFFGNIKNYNNNIRTNNPGKSPDITKRKNILDSSPDKIEYYEKKIYTYKRGNKFNSSNKKTPNNLFQIESKVNDVYISSCYDNPQRDHIIKMVNEKRKQNPDKIVEVLFTQFPSPVPFYSNMYQPYGQYNPYMYMMPSPNNYPMQPPMINPSLNDGQIPQYNNINNKEINNTNNYNVTTKGNLSESQNSLNSSDMNRINNITPITPNMNYNLNNNYLSASNNIVVDNLNNKSIVNMSNSGNINSSSSFK
jgi:hypothetical protein